MSRALFLAAASVLLSAAPALAQGGSASATGAASATIVAPIAVRQIADLDFGVVAAGASQAGSVTILPGISAARYDGSARQSCGAGGKCPAPHFASFEVSGEAGRAYTIATPASVAIGGDALGDGVGAAPVLRVEAIGLRSASRPGAGPAGTLDPAGRDRFDLGGTLRLPATVAPARYRVSIPVIVTYS